MNYKKVIFDLKCQSFSEANIKAIPVLNMSGIKLGKLVPVGLWIADDIEKIRLICAWRQRNMRMFLTQFESTFDRTLAYLKNLSIARDGCILFLIYDISDRLVGHIGIANVDGNSGELDNLMRGVDGGDPRLVYFSEIALLDWCFKTLGINQSEVRFLSYNWLVLSLHEEVGYSFISNSPLKKYEKDSVIFHDVVPESELNVNYSSIKMLLKKDDFYKNAYWIL
jgi:hypothetical protein